MHVLQLGPYPPPEGGVNRNILAIRDELLRQGHECSIVATSRSTSVKPEANVYHPRTAFQLLALLYKLRFDVLHLHVGGDIGARVLALIFVSAIAGRGRSVFTLHSGAYPLSSSGRRARAATVRGFLFRLFDRVVAVNPAIAEVFERYGVDGERIAVIYPFIHALPNPDVTVPDPLRKFAEDHSPFLLTVGLLEEEYDLFAQIDAMKQIRAAHPNAGLMIIGSGSLGPKLEQAVSQKTYAEHVYLAGDVKHAVTLHLINHSDLLLRTTLYDGDAISIREAIFLGTPVIATDNGLRPGGVHLIPSGHSSVIAEKVREVLKKGRVKNDPIKADNANVRVVVSLYETLADRAEARESAIQSEG